MMMPEKLVNSVTQWPILRLTRRVGVLVSVALLALLLVWSIDQSVVFDFLRYPRETLSQKLLDNSTKSANSKNSQNSTLYDEFNATHVSFFNDSDVLLPRIENPDEILVNSSQSFVNVSSGLDYRNGGDNDVDGVGVPEGQLEGDLDRFSGEFDPKGETRNLSHGLDWVSVEFEQNYSSNLLSRWLAPGGEACKDSKTVDIRFVGFDDGKEIVLSTGNAHEVVFQALDELGNLHCVGDDYFEIDLSGESWKSRAPIKDWGNGTYSFTLQVHPDFPGTYNLTIILLFRHFEGLKFSTARFGYDQQLRNIPVTFTESEAILPELHLCRKSDFNRDVWTGRWTRHGKNDACEISNDGRYRCLESDYPCTNPWCNGSLGMLESNGWVYSAHCSFRLLSADDAWHCLDNRWLFFWGDSNHVDTIRNILFFYLHVPYQELDIVSRRFDNTFTNPKNKSQSVRITNIFNGHWNMTKNYEGLNSLANEGYRNLVKSFFNGSAVPDTIILNSGLHDGIHWHNVRRFIQGAEDAASFWKEIMEGVKQKGLAVSNFIFRSTITTGGYARTLSFNPSKMEVFNGILLDKLKAAGLITGVVDDFDMTWAWHFDNRCNDGVHYGRFPAKMKWRDGQIGHQYFVDLMLGQVLLNAICAR
ncbi:uncharacterized protein LOC110722135 [Chenopodium quinoa]|uniref:uncharacterized protein LOC110722135 n=1 Tax=Chenopodium quinoa TaxID=63459 RepID=UPI000B7714C4|nr:uncharacterized protein LOC110722135 [Chenopodium quinoa]